METIYNLMTIDYLPKGSFILKMNVSPYLSNEVIQSLTLKPETPICSVCSVIIWNLLI